MPNEITIQEMGSLARAFAQSGFFGYKNEAEAFTLMAIAQANGLAAAKAAERYHVIQGKPAMKSEAMLASFQEAGGKVRWVKRTDTECRLWLSHAQGGEIEVCWTMERVQKAGLANKDNWKKFPAQMLSARCVSEGVRALFPACLCGMYTPEEVSDFDAKAPTAADNIRAQGGTVIDTTTAEPKTEKPQLTEAQKAFMEEMKSWKASCPEVYKTIIDEVKSRFGKLTAIPESKYEQIRGRWNDLMNAYAQANAATEEPVEF